MKSNDLDFKQLFEESEFKREQIEFDYQEVVKLNKNLNQEIMRLQDELDKDLSDKIKSTEEDTSNQLRQQYEDEIERITNDRGKLRKELDQAKEKIDELIKEKNTLIIKFESEKDELSNEIDRLKNDELCDRVNSLKDDNNKLIMDLVKNKKEFHIKLQQDRELIDSLKAELDSLKYYFEEATNNYQNELKEINFVLRESRKQKDYLTNENSQLRYQLELIEHELLARESKINKLEECIRMQKKYLYELKHYFEGDLKNETQEVCLTMNEMESRQDQYHRCIIEIPIERGKVKRKKISFNSKLNKFQLLQEKLLKCEEDLIEFTRRKQHLKKSNHAKLYC